MRLAALFLSGIALAGCASAPVVVRSPSVSFQQDFPKVWLAAIDSLDSMGFQIKQALKDDGIIITEPIDTKRYKKSGWEGNAQFGQQQMRTIATGGVQSERARATVKISRTQPVMVDVRADVEHLEGESGWMSVPSNGKLEKRIKDEIASRLR